MARRFIVESKDIKKINEENFEIYGEEVKHIQVLRFNILDEIHINDKICKILDMKRDSITLKIERDASSFGEPSIDITMYIAVLKGEKMDLVIQKAVELGVKNIVPFFSKNVVVKLDEKDRIKKKEKYQKIANEACKQCGRTDKVEIFDFLNFDEVINDIYSYDRCFFAYEKSDNNLSNEFTKVRNSNLKNIAFIIGAEGGFTKDEVQKIELSKNVLNISLGKRILRAETAAISLLSIIIYELDR